MFAHIAVLLRELVDGVVQKPGGVYVDMTLGGAGHATALAEMLLPAGRLIGIDRDEAALAAARERLRDVKCRVDLVRSNYADLPAVLRDLGIAEVDGIICDLGVSSHQLDTAERGFSYMQDGLLDMRMDRRQELSAYEVVNSYGEQELADIIRNYGEERWARRIAQFIVAARREAPLQRTSELVDVIKRAIPAGARKDGPHPAKRTFQAIRIEVNGELRDLEGALRQAVTALAPQGRIGVISFHSLEDRTVKNLFRELATGCTCPPQFPVCVCGKKAILQRNIKKIKPSKEEVAANPRARSAILRIAEKM
ncbi:MAG: 16S rRNA (cytosine(1402)-N(4))-methyltransferase RsmH [Veillonellaceae bacterium]|nr:16S rRNA (cytosine(1402)-N(4))-methyltransferase RsmH [Veillonellaceae bacterium]